MQTPEDVQAMLKLSSLGWGAKRISRELGCSRKHGAQLPAPRRLAAVPTAGTATGPADVPYRDWLDERFRQHRGNCDVVRQELQREHGIAR